MKPRLDRVKFNFDDSSVLEYTKYWNDKLGAQFLGNPEDAAMKKLLEGTAYIDAGTLPNITITPPKNSKAVQKSKEMLPIKLLRDKWYNKISDLSDYKGFDQREYIDRIYNIYDASGKPSVTTTRGPEYAVVNPFEIAGKDRNMYNPIFNRIYLNPTGQPRFEDELSHAFQNSGGVPTGGVSLPGDIEYKGLDGYKRPGHPEYIAHYIIQPILQDYYEQRINNSVRQIKETIRDVNAHPKKYGMPTRKEAFEDAAKQNRPKMVRTIKRLRTIKPTVNLYEQK